MYNSSSGVRHIRFIRPFLYEMNYFVVAIITNEQKIPGKYGPCGNGLDKWNNTKLYWLDKPLKKKDNISNTKIHRMMIDTKKIKQTISTKLLEILGKN